MNIQVKDKVPTKALATVKFKVYDKVKVMLRFRFTFRLRFKFRFRLRFRLLFGN